MTENTNTNNTFIVKSYYKRNKSLLFPLLTFTKTTRDIDE